MLRGVERSEVESGVALTEGVRQGGRPAGLGNLEDRSAKSVVVGGTCSMWLTRGSEPVVPGSGGAALRRRMSFLAPFRILLR